MAFIYFSVSVPHVEKQLLKDDDVSCRRYLYFTRGKNPYASLFQIDSIIFCKIRLH